MNDLLKKLKKIFITEFGLKENEVTNNLDYTEVEMWDSLGHLQLIMTIESAFGIKFETNKIPILTNFPILIKEIQNVIQ